MRQQSWVRRGAAACLAGLLLLAMAGCQTPATPGKQGIFPQKISAGNTVDLLEGILPQRISAEEQDSLRCADTAEFSLRLLERISARNAGQTTLISPLSILTALAMTANGARGETLRQMEQVLCGGKPIGSLNRFLSTYRDEQPSLRLANSIWYRSGHIVPDAGFLQNTADFYDAGVYESPFDEKTLHAINRWVNSNTDGEIDKVLEEIPANVVMYLINALAFEADWDEVYTKEAVRDAYFTAADGARQETQLMYSREHTYLRTQNATGFLKPYAGGRYCFAAILPEAGISPEAYLSGLTGEALVQVFETAQQAPVNAALPKFRCTFEDELSGSLRGMGMQDAFGDADFSGMGETSQPLSISSVIHKTTLRVDERGTKAGAVTVVAMAESAAAEPPPQVILDRPFLCAILDNETGLPIFLGIINTLLS